MKTRISLNQALKKVAVGFLSVLAILALAFPVTGGAYAQAPVPWLIAFPENDAVEGWEWPEGAIVYLTINNAPEGFIREGTAEVTSWGDPRTYIRFDFAGEDGYDLQVGDLVTLTDEFGTTTTHEVQPLSITGVDRDTNIVTGTANNDAFLQVWVHAQSEPPVEPTVINGTWQADLTGVFDITYGTGGRAWVIVEGGNATAVDWYVPNPHFTVFPEWEFFDGLEWPDGALVSISVEGKDECSLEKESWGYFFNGNFGDNCNIEVGDVVTFTDGETIRTHTVRNLAITKVNQEDDTVTGTSDAGAEVFVWPHATGEQQMVIASPKGKWNVSFAGVYDLKPGDEGRAQVLDEMGNATAVDWRVPKPRIVASITEDWFYLQEFSPNTTLKYTVYRAQAEKPIWKGTATTDDSGFVWIDAEGRWDLEPGNYLVVNDGSNGKDLIIEGFTFDVFNLSNGQLSGTAPEPFGRDVWVGIGWQGQDAWTMNITTNENGDWFADFGQPVSSDYQWVAAQIFDEDGDGIELRPSQVYPTIFAWLEWDNVDGHGWRTGETVTLTINEDEHVLTQVAETPDIAFNLQDVGHDLTVGDQITMTDDLITKQLLVPDITITDYDLGGKTISGTYDPNLGFYTYVNGQTPIDIAYDGDTWTAQFDNLGPNMWGDAIQRDSDGDEAAATIHTPNPNLYAVPDENRIFAQGWNIGYMLSLKIYDSTGNLIHSDSQMVDPPSIASWTVNIFEGFDIQPGQRIVLSQRGYERELLVSSLVVTGFDLVNHQVLGTGDPGAQIFVYINGQDVWGTVDGSGNWTITHPQLGPGVWGEAIQPDGIDGDETRDGFQASWS